MCGLCGFLSYGNEKVDVKELTNALLESSADRGTDACGIAYSAGGHITVHKVGKSAYSTTFTPPKNIKAMIGHTRHSTQGSESKNYNNHPFCGRVGKTHFALAHNGVLFNDDELRKTHNLPATKIETDSYIAVQLLEKEKQFNHNAMKSMAESVRGSFSFSVLDNQNNLHLIKGDSPLCILHFKRMKMYVYASMETILWKALIETELFDELKSGDYEAVPIKNGEILTITSSGKLKRSSFAYSDYSGYDWRTYGSKFYDYDYITDLKTIAPAMGYSADDIDMMFEDGYMPENIEDIIYSGLEGFMWSI